MTFSILARSICVIAASAVVQLACTNSAVAQRSSESQYRPATPTLSPYVGLLQGNRGGIPNYFSLVRPRLEQRAFNRQLQRTSRVQTLAIQSLSTDADAVTPTPQTGKAAGFEQYLHFYPTIVPRAPVARSAIAR